MIEFDLAFIVFFQYFLFFFNLKKKSLIFILWIQSPENEKWIMKKGKIREIFTNWIKKKNADPDHDQRNFFP